MKICVISGGSGNDALITGLKSIYPESDVKVLVNAYDAGKSTGVCRQVTNTLGVSDIRKNHIRMYKAMNPAADKRLIEFYEDRYNFTSGKEVEEIIAKLKLWDLEFLGEYVINFFNQPTANNYAYFDFNVSNIVYSQMYAEKGYAETNRFFTSLLGLNDFVILNSFDNIFIKAKTASGFVIQDEGDIVEYCNPDDKIVSMDYDLKGISYGINPTAIEVVNEADLIVISTGTFWSSIYPTLDYLDFYKVVNEATGKKIWAINCAEDNDAYGVSANEFIDHFEKLGLDLTQFTILENQNADGNLCMSNDKYHVVSYPMGNKKGKHDGLKYATAILKLYYNIDSVSTYDKIIFDFDDTLFGRNYQLSSTVKNSSITNIQMINDLSDKALIVSGNSYSSIAQKLAIVYGSSLKELKVPIWADANSKLYIGNDCVDIIDELVIHSDSSGLAEYLSDHYNLPVERNSVDTCTCIKIKPLSHGEQHLLADYLNNYLLEYVDMQECVANVTGTSTVDIVNGYNTKAAVIKHIGINPDKVLYIGDEIDNGNDRDISRLCGCSIHTSGVNETTTILKLLLTNI